MTTRWLASGRSETEDSEVRTWGIAFGVIGILIAIALSFETVPYPTSIEASAALGIGGFVFAWLRKPYRWVSYNSYGGETFNFLRGEDNAECENFIKVLESRLALAAPGQITHSQLNLLRRTRCPAENAEAYAEMIASLNEDTYVLRYAHLELLGQSASGEFCERWTYNSENNRLACEEWMAETKSGKEFVRKWTELGIEVGEFEVWVVDHSVS